MSTIVEGSELRNRFEPEYTRPDKPPSTKIIDVIIIGIEEMAGRALIYSKASAFGPEMDAKEAKAYLDAHVEDDDAWGQGGPMWTGGIERHRTPWLRSGDGVRVAQEVLDLMGKRVMMYRRLEEYKTKSGQARSVKVADWVREFSEADEGSGLSEESIDIPKGGVFA